jgi:drug/metabolite transporter (DMT)-like permease
VQPRPSPGPDARAIAFSEPEAAAVPVASAGRGAVPASRGLLVAEAAAILVMLTWGANIVAVKAALADVPPVLFAWVRFSVAFLVMLAVLRWREGSVGLPRQDVLPMLALGLIGFGVYQDLWATALGRTTAANSALITAATPVSAILISVAVGSDTISRAKVAGAAIAFCGAAGVVVATHGIGLGGASGGDLLTFAATICWAVYVAFGAPVLSRHSPLRVSTWAVGFGTLGMLPFGLWQLISFDTSRVSAGTVGLFLYCTLLAAAASNVVMFEAVRTLGPARAVLFQFLVPAFAVVFAALFLGEAIVLGQIAGGAVIVAGIMVSRSGAPDERRAHPRVIGRRPRGLT